MIKEEIESAIENYQRANQNFEFAEEDFIDIAIWELKIAVEKLDLLLRKTREGTLNAPSE